MNYIDRKVAKSALKLTRVYDQGIFFDGGQKLSKVHDAADPEEYLILKIPSQDILPAIERLNEKGYLRLVLRPNRETCVFTITPDLNHFWSFFVDKFTKKFWSGVFTGVLSTILIGSLASPIQQALSVLSAYILSLLGR